ncbi:hypothetical protein WJX72_004943 [[Myrmecia] bisecta]|uniref:Transcription factor Pur-alpha 1 n=1 Tax=[Myrmecia] bisecta TaxID=41462 RepID=A0AAW1Q729_9CHLO
MHGPTPGSGLHGGEVEVCAETLRIESKLFYLDLKENSRGRYLKIAEKGSNRERSTVIVPKLGIPWFRELFNYYAAGVDEQGRPVVNKELPIETKIFYFEVGENPRGRFLRISETGGGPRGRSSIIIPAGGPNGGAWASMRDALVRMEAAANPGAPQTEVDIPELPSTSDAAAFFSSFESGLHISVAGPQTVVGPGPTPPTIMESGSGGQIVRAGHKRFFFDMGSNPKGSFLRITEVVGADRIAIIVPSEALPQFRSALLACLDQHEKGLGHGGAGPSSSSTAP